MIFYWVYSRKNSEFWVGCNDSKKFKKTYLNHTWLLSIHKWNLNGVKAPWWNHLVKIHFVKSVIWWMCFFKWWNELAHREIWYHLVKKIFNSWNCHSIGENEYQLVIINSIREHFSDSDDTSLAIYLSIYSENDILSHWK